VFIVRRCLLWLLQIHAAQGAFKHMRVSFQRASGEAGSLTVTPDHLIMRITAPGVVIGSTAGRVTECEYVPFRFVLQSWHLQALLQCSIVSAYKHCCVGWLSVASGSTITEYNSQPSRYQDLHVLLCAAPAVGAFETVPAAQIIKNDRIVVMKDPADHTAGYYVTAVTAVDAVEAEGIYVPAVASPYIVADGVVAPL
jgi:hypothetical protein